MSQPSESDPLAAFLYARLDEDEADAQRASEYASTEWHLNDIGDTVLCFPPEPRVAEAERRHGLAVTSDQWRGVTIDFSSLPPHIARHDPARVLAEVAVKRRIIYLATQIPALTAKHNPFENDADGWAETLKQLALPYASHPDYDEGWRP